MCKVARAREWGTPQHATAGTRLPPRCPSLWRAGQACVAAVLTTNAVHSGVHTWNSPVWPLLPLLLNRLTELLALSFGHTESPFVHVGAIVGGGCASMGSRCACCRT